ncbi:hypothetical protein LZG00_15885 [Rhodobacteraceae bacterium LMO-12]|nr:hypothetical protein [Rhodobacteraceae bacterium LMO-JJ12]
MDWIPIVISALALLISVLSLHQSKTTQQRTWRLEAKRSATRLRLVVEGLPERIERTKKSAHDSFASRGMYQSGARESDDRKICENKLAVETLRNDLEDATKSVDSLSDKELEKCLVDLEALERKITGITGWLDARESEHKKLVDERRKEMNRSFSD